MQLIEQASCVCMFLDTANVHCIAFPCYLKETVSFTVKSC